MKIIINKILTWKFRENFNFQLIFEDRQFFRSKRYRDLKRCLEDVDILQKELVKAEIIYSFDKNLIE